MEIPPELSEEEITIITQHLSAKERKMFLDNLTRDMHEADPHKDYYALLPSSRDHAWLKAPCMFLDFEVKKGKKRATCRIFKIRPRMCRMFFCGRKRLEEPLMPSRYKYELRDQELIERLKVIQRMRGNGNQF